jgi:hypothetical protein
MTVGYLLLTLFVAMMFIYPQWRARRKTLSGNYRAINNAEAAPAALVTTPTPPSQSLMSRIKAGTVGRMSLTIFVFLLLGALFIIFQILPQGLIAASSGIVMSILIGVAILAMTMLVTGWGNLLPWATLLIVSLTLAWQTPVQTASQVVETTTTLKNEGIGGLITAATKPKPPTAEEKAAALAIQKAENERLAMVAAGEAKAREAARIAEERAREEALRPAKVEPCVRKNTDKTNCVTVTFGYMTYYDREDIVGHCIMPTLAEPDIIIEPLGGGRYRFKGQPGQVLQVFDLPKGKSYNGGPPCVES